MPYIQHLELNKIKHSFQKFGYAVSIQCSTFKNKQTPSVALNTCTSCFHNGVTYLPSIIAVRAVVPEERDDSREHDFAKAASVSTKDLVTTFSSSIGKSASSTMTLGK